jgi:hypothetical protein
MIKQAEEVAVASFSASSQHFFPNEEEHEK